MLRSGKVFYSLLNRHSAVSTFQTVGALALVAVFLGAVAMFRLEGRTTPFFATFGNSLWWSLLTTTTLGFAQDVHPATVEGRVASMLLIGAGIILVGTFTGMVPDYFINDEEISQKLTDVEKRLVVIEEKVDKVLRKLDDE